MTNRAPIIAYLLTALSVTLSGCASWTGVSQPVSDTRSALTLPSQQFRPSVRGKDEVAGSEATETRGPSAVKKMPPTAPSSRQTIIRGQQPESTDGADLDYSEDYRRQPLPTSGVGSASRSDGQVMPVQYSPPNSAAGDPWGNAPYDAPQGYAPPGNGPPTFRPGIAPPAVGPPMSYGNPSIVPGPEFDAGPSDMVGSQPYTGRLADLIVNVREQQTGRFMFGVGVNSDAGLTAQVVIDEYNFDWRRFPRSVDDIMNGTAWRGGGQRLRIEAIPGNQLQRYLVNFTEPYLLDTNISLNLSGFLYDRRYFDWDEQRLGGRIGLGYRVTPDLSLSTGIRMENVNINDPRLRGVPELEEVLGDNSLFSGRVSLTHDTRDSPFAATEGHMLELSFEQAFGSFDYPRGVIDYRRYFLLSQRPDRSGRHTLGTSMQVGISGSQTPVYENFFAGGYSTIRGFRFRSAAPKSGDIFVGGEFSMLGSVEYMFPITADDMLKGVVFCDYGTIEEEVQIDYDDYRIAFGAGLRISVPAMGPAPIAVDFAVPVAREDTDRIQNFSFFVGFGR